MSNYTFTLNMIPNTGTPVVVNLSQGDIGRELTFKLVEGSDPNITIATDATAITIEGTKPSGLGFSEPCTATSGNTITVSTTEAMTQESGMIPAEVRFVAGAKDLGTANIIFAIEESPHPSGTTDGTQETMQNLEARLQTEIDGLDDRIEALEAGGGGSGSGGITVVSLVSEMTDTSSVYLYNGTEIGYTAGHWYFWNTGTSRWTDGGEYTGWETVDTALENFLEENAQEMGTLTVVVGSTTYTYNGLANVSITLPIYDGGVS